MLSFIWLLTDVQRLQMIVPRLLPIISIYMCANIQITVKTNENLVKHLCYHYQVESYTTF